MSLLHRNLLRFALLLGVLFSVASARVINAQTSDTPSNFEQVAAAFKTSEPITPEINPTSYLESRISQLETELESLKVGVSPCHCESGASAGSCNRAGWDGGAGVVWFKPHFKEAFQYSKTTIPLNQNNPQVPSPNSQRTQDLVPFQYDYQATGRYWLGFKNANQVGLRMDYWGFDANGASSSNTALIDFTTGATTLYGAHAVNIIFPANIATTLPGQTLVTEDSVKTNMLNLYGTYDTVFSGIEMSTGAGLRFANFEQDIRADVYADPTTTGPAVASIEWFRRFKGAGPSLKFEGKKRLACSRFSALASGGGALLFGKKEISRGVYEDVTPSTAQVPATLNFSEADEVVGVGEMSLGLEWSTALSNGCQLNLRGTYEGQLWSEGGAPTLGFLGYEGFGLLGELRR